MRDFIELLFSAVDGLHQAGRVSAGGDGLNQPAKFLLDLFPAVAHSRHLTREFGERHRQLPLEFVKCVSDYFGPKLRLLELEEQPVFQPVNPFLQPVWAGAAVEVLGAAVPLVAFLAPTRHNNEVGATQSTYQKPGQQVLAGCCANVKAGARATAESLGYKREPIVAA